MWPGFTSLQTTGLRVIIQFSKVQETCMSKMAFNQHYNPAYTHRSWQPSSWRFKSLPLVSIAFCANCLRSLRRDRRVHYVWPESTRFRNWSMPLCCDSCYWGPTAQIWRKGFSLGLGNDVRLSVLVEWVRERASISGFAPHKSEISFPTYLQRSSVELFLLPSS